MTSKNLPNNAFSLKTDPDQLQGVAGEVLEQGPEILCMMQILKRQFRPLSCDAEHQG